MSVELFFGADGVARAIYTDDVDLRELATAIGEYSIERASHVEPDQDGRWRACLSPQGGPHLGPFARRADALAAETAWLRERLATS
jgi:hypothetical protein